MNQVELLNKEVSKDNFNFYEIAIARLTSKFEEEIGYKKVIPYKELYKFFGLQLSLKKEQTKLLLKELSYRYPIKLGNQGIRLEEDTQ